MYSLTQHQKDALNHSKHISLTANAGSGKTFVLARRYLSILLEEDISLNNIVAITFTDKAASELYKRIANEIELRLSESGNTPNAKKLEKLRRELVSAKISTIHSFCTEMLKEFPTEAGIDANFIPIDQRISNELITSSIDEIIQNSIRNNDNLVEYVKNNIRLLGSKKILQSVLKKMIAKRRDVEKVVQTVYSKGENETAKIFNKLFLEYFAEIFDEKVDDLIFSIKEINDKAKTIKEDNTISVKVDGLLLTLDKADTFKLISSVNEIFTEILTQKGTVRATGFLSKKNREGIHNAIYFIEEFYSEFKVINFSEDFKSAELELAKYGYDILKLWNPIIERYNRKKMQKGYLDFEDLLLLAEKLVMREDVKSYLATRYKYFMIDEYQDTNETQYNIFIPILDYLKRGNLFVVGDEKQSIYMFRGADLQIFNKTKEVIKEAGDESSLLQLPHSFRLSKELTLFTNKLFGKLFENPKSIFNEVKYDNLVYAKTEETESEIAFLLSNGSSDSESEYELVAKKIVELVENNKVEFKDIAILSRKKKSFFHLEKELLKYKIPYLIYGGKGFYQRQEIYDVYNYLSFLLNPKSDEALVAVLRSPFFMLTDRVLYQISKYNGDSFYEKFINYAYDKNELDEVLGKLQSNIQSAKSKQLSVLVREMLQESGYWAKVASSKNSEQIFANLDKLINVAISFVDKGSTTLYDFVAYLKDAINKTEDESQAVISEDDKNVKLMTIHASKGLEFPILFLVDTNSKSMDDRVKSKSVSVDKDFGILTKTANENYLEANVTAPIVGIFNYVNIKKNSAELKRLLYVAVTRAESYLFISATFKENPAAGSFLSLFQQGLNIKEFTGSEILNGEISYLHEEDKGFVNSNKNVEIEIPFIRGIEIDNQNIHTKYEETETKFEININVINDVEQNEIISASKISVYNQCPLKYYLVYDLGYTSLFYKEKEELLVDELDKEKTENSYSLPANIQGSIIHQILEEEIEVEKLSERIEEILQSNSENFNKEDLSSIKLNIINMIENYYNSNIYEKLGNYNNYRNEYEIYIKQNDFYLYGIIDKLILDGNTAYIIDYKTDSLKKYSAIEKLENYKYQLMFYAFLVSKMNAKIEKIICQLVFIESPDENTLLEIDTEMLKSFESKMLVGINLMRKGKYNKNKFHCKSCYFSDEKNNCIV